MPIESGVLRFGYVGDRGVGDRLIREVLDGHKTATCLPVAEMSSAMLHETRAAVGRTITATGPEGHPSCQILVTRVYETTADSPASSMLVGEGYGEDADAFLRAHYAPRLAVLPEHLDAISDDALDILRAASPPHRAVVELHDILGWSLEELSEGLERPIHVVRQQLRRGRLTAARAEPSGPSCRRVRRTLRELGGEEARIPAGLKHHLDLCSRCSALLARLQETPMEPPDRAESWDEAAIVRQRTGRDPAAAIRFLVVEFQRVD